jgi:hypothetical protein
MRERAGEEIRGWGTGKKERWKFLIAQAKQARDTK